MHKSELDGANLKGWQIWLPLAVGAAMAAGIFGGLMIQKQEPSLIVNEKKGESSKMGYGRMEELIRYIDARYVDEVEDEELVEEAIDHLLDQLDPHSSYIPQADIKSMNDKLRGDFDGIGIEFMILDDTLMVVAPLEGGPSEEAGILAGDKIVQVGDSTIAGKGMGSEAIVNFLRGEKGSDVRLGIKRIRESELLFFEVTRDKIPNKSVDVSYLLQEEIGYIKVNRFSANTYKDFMHGVEDLFEKQGMKHLVIDLRQNPGGYLQEATKMLSQLFDEREKIMVYTEGVNSTRSDYKTSGGNFFDLEKIAVLIDEGSASASEIIAGAIQDWDRGVIVGRRSFGKGLVQEQYKLSDGSALHLTVSRYYTPSGRSIQRDYSDKEEYDDDFAARFKSGELQDPEKFKLRDTTEYFTAGGRVVYGGGGIMPDVFVPLDTFLFSTYYLYLRSEINSFAFRHYEDNKAAFAEWKDESKYINKFEISDELFEEYLAYAEKNAKLSKRNESILKEVSPALKRRLKARLGKHCFKEATFYKINNHDDPMIDEAIRWILDKNPLVKLED